MHVIHIIKDDSLACVYISVKTCKHLLGMISVKDHSSYDFILESWSWTIS